MKKLPALLSTPARAAIAVGMIMLVSEVLIMLLTGSVITPFIKHELWDFIDPVLLIAIVSPALYLLIFRPMRAQQAEMERQLDELRRFQRVSIGRELRMKELVEEIAALRHPLAAEPAGDIPVTSGSPETMRDAAEQPITTQPIEEGQRSALLFMLEDLEAVRKKVEQAHQEWMGALDVMGDPIFLHDQQFRILRCNKAYQQLAGMPFKQIIGQPYYEVFPKTGAPLPCCLQAMEKTEAEIAEGEMLIGGATYRSRTFAIKDEQGAYLYSVHTLEDITEKQRAEAERQRLSEAIHHAAEAIAMVNADACFTYINPAFTRLFGYAPEEIISQSTAILSVPAAETVQPDAAFHIIREQGFFQGEALRRAKDGTTLPVYINVAALHGSGGKFEGLVAAITDLRPIKKSQQALVESEEKFRSLVHNIPDVVWTTDQDGKTSFISDNVEKIYGYTPAEIYADPDLWFGSIHPDDVGRVSNAFSDCFTANRQFDVEYRIQREDGEWIWLHDRSLVSYEKGGICYADGVFTDISERKRADEELRLRAQLLDSASDTIFMVDFDGNFIYLNEATWKTRGYTRDEMIGINLHVLDTPKYEKLIESRMRDIKERGQCIFESEHRRKDGSVMPVEINARTIESGGRKLVLSVIRDITERQRAEAEIQHTNRALATLSAVNHTLVHATDENTLLRAICDAIVEQNGYWMAWVGYVQHDEHKSIRIMARAGQDEGYLDAMQLTWAETERGMRPCGRAIRSGTTQVCQDIAHDPRHLPWHDAALKRGYAASIALPLARRGGKVFGTLAVYSDEVNAFGPAEVALLEEMAGDLAFGVRALQIRHERNLAQDKVQQQVVQLQDSLEDTVRAMAGLVEMRDPYTAGHQVRVADLAAAIAKQMELPDEQVHALHLAGIVHDLGKIKIPAEILSKPGRINDIEFNLIKVHPQAGYDILKGIDFPWPIAQMILQHHERLDGSGYPQGLKGEAILLEARILSLADVVEAMSSHRPYRPGLGIDVALAEITQQRGVHYDPQVVDACLAVFREQHYSFKEGGGLSLPDGNDNAGDRGQPSPQP